MKNILSFVDTPILGSEIIEWIEFHVKNKTEYSKIANSMKGYLDTIYPSRKYWIELNPQGTGCGERKRYKPELILCTKICGQNKTSL